MKTGILKKTLTSPRWSHCVSAIKKGTVVEFKEEKSMEGNISVKHLKQDVFITCIKKEYIV